MTCQVLCPQILHREGCTPPLARGAAARRALGAAQASGPAPTVGNPPPQRCPRAAIRTCCPAAAALASRSLPHPAPRAPTFGCSAAPAPQALLLSPECRRESADPSKPLVSVFEFATPPGGARDFPRMDPLPPQKSLKKSSSPKSLCPGGSVESSARLCFTEPLLPLGSWAEGGTWALAVILRLIRSGEERERQD